MGNKDDILQKSLEELERGVPIDKVLADLPDDDHQLAQIIRLAAAANKMPHPVLNPSTAQVQKKRVMAAARTRQAKPVSTGLFGFRWSALVIGGGMAGIVGGLALVLIATGALVFYLTRPINSHTAKLSGVNGLVEVASTAQSNDWVFLTGDTQVQQGERIHTYADSSVTLAYRDGSQTVIGPDSDVILTTLNWSWGNSIQVLLSQNAGTTSHEVIPLRGSSSFYRVNTPSGLVSVHGTAFDVQMDDRGTTLFDVTHGIVQISYNNSDIFLTSGQASAAFTGESLTQPAYQFRLQGAINALTPTQWTVDGVNFLVTPQTNILGTFKVGDKASVRGLILSNGQWVATSIEPAVTPLVISTFTGVVQTMAGVPGIWQISGQHVQVDQVTQLSQGLKVGSPVKVSFMVLPNGAGWLATNIQSLEEEEPTPTPTLTATSTVTNTETPTSTETHTPTVTGTLPTLTETMTITPTITGTLPTPTETMTPTITGTLPTPTSTLTPTMTLTPTPTVIPKNNTNRCDNLPSQQPEALRLAQRFNVPYADIIMWFCKGFGFGEIDLAYNLSLSSGRPVSNIFSMRSGGMGWGNIRKFLAANPATQVPVSGQSTPTMGINPQTTPGPDNGNGNGNGNGKGKGHGPKNK